MIRIALVDDHRLIREALRTVIERESDMEVVAEADDAGTALSKVQEHDPDLVVMDVSLIGPSGIEATRTLLAAKPGIKVLALSTHLERHVIRQMLDAGASGYITKAAAGGDLVRGIRCVLSGRCYLCPEAASLLAESLRTGQPSSTRSGDEVMSPRELQVITLLAEGRTAPEIAVQLHISPHTVNAHRRKIMSKLKATSVVDITKYAIRTGLVRA